MTLSEIHDLEAAVMELMWSYERGVDVGELVGDLRQSRAVSPTLVAKLVNRLHRTGWLRRELVDGAYFYEPTASRKQYSDRLMREALASGQNSTPAFVLRLPSSSSAWMPIRCARR